MAENNRVAPKFQTNFVGHDLPQDQGIDRLKYWANEFLRLGLAPDYGEGAYGNLSFRTKSGFIITCTRFGPADIDHSQSYVQVTDVDLNKMVVHAQGMREPSS